MREGEVCQFEGYIHKGCVRVYYLDDNGFEVTILFAIEDWWISDIASFQDQKPSNLYIETIEDSEIFMLDPATKEKLLKEIPKFERVFRMLVQRNLFTLQNRLVNTISKSASDRYLEFIKVYPTIPQRVAQYYIAWAFQKSLSAPSESGWPAKRNNGRLKKHTISLLLRGGGNSENF